MERTDVRGLEFGHSADWKAPNPNGISSQSQGSAGRNPGLKDGTPLAFGGELPV